MENVAQTSKQEARQPPLLRVSDFRNAKYLVDLFLKKKTLKKNFQAHNNSDDVSRVSWNGVEWWL